MSDEKSKRKKYIVVAIVAALLLLGGTITAVCIANSNNNTVQVAEQSTQSTVQSSIAESSTESSTESMTAESSTVSENSTKENSATAQTSKTAQESSNTSSKAETSKTETSSKPETSKAESSTTTQQNQQPNGNGNNQTSTTTTANTSTPVETSKPSTSTETSKPSTPVETSKPSTPTTIAVTSISLNKSSLSLTVGDSATLKATIAPSNATNKSYSFSSSNNSVATVNSNGTVVAKKVGSCTITVKSSNGKTAKCSVTVKAKATSSDNGGTSSTGKSGIASIPAGAKSYQTKSYDGKKTYTVYECPEVVKYINEYRKQAGLKEVKWKTLDYMNQHAYDTVYSIPEKAEEVKEYFPEDYEKAFDKNGNYVGEYNYNDWLDATQSTRNAVAYMLGTNAIYHADEMQWSASIQKTGGSTFNPSLWISNIKTSPDHWNMLMSSKVDAVYCTYGVTTDGYFYVAIL